MCGIAGVYQYGDLSPVSPELVRRMTEVLAHRGPDGDGVFVDGPIGLGHQRLAIQDLSDNGNQPMVLEEAGLAVTYNGEIYNSPELRLELEAKGHRFRSRCDTETLLHAYREWGADCLDRLSGIFAFALWDGPHRTLFLARDPLGVKPLFYSLDSAAFRFGSEVKAILRDPRVDREFCDQGLDEFFTFSYCAAPNTGLRNVKQLLPGHFARVTSEGMETHRYWEIPYVEPSTEKSEDEGREEFSALLDRSVQRQTLSDVPVGAFLSGGLDSTAILGSLRNIGRSETKAFSIGFNEASFDELPFARRVATSLGFELAEERVDLDAVDLLREISKFMEEPTADSSMIPVYLLCRMAARERKVVLSGDGADEILAGYETYRANRWASRYRKIPAGIRHGILAPLARRIPANDRKYGFHQIANRFIAGAEAGPGRDHCSWRLMATEAQKDRVYAPGFRGKTSSLDAVGRYASRLSEPPAGRPDLTRHLHADTTFYLPNDMLVKVDRMSMAYGLEVRVPFLDKEVVGFCANLPTEMKLRRGRIRKHILRESLRGKGIPNAILDRPKSGFNIPVEAWMRQPRMKEFFMDSLARQEDTIGRYLRTSEIEILWNEHAERKADRGHLLFTILMFCLWVENVSAPPAGLSL